MRILDADAMLKMINSKKGMIGCTGLRNYINFMAKDDKDIVEVVRCKDCKYFELNHWDGPIITAHEICSKWGNGCKTDRNGYCFIGERKTDG